MASNKDEESPKQTDEAPKDDTEVSEDDSTEEKGADAEPAETDSSEVEATPKDTASVTTSPDKRRSPLARLLSNKKRSIPLAILILIIICLAIPFTRYEILGVFLKKQVTVTVVDSKTDTPVSAVDVELNGKKLETNNLGKATGNVRLGRTTLTATKQYYKTATASETITLSANHNSFKIELVATGRQVPVSVVNTISGAPIANATIIAAGAKTTTDNSGKAVIVVPANLTKQKVALVATGYNGTTATMQVTAKSVPANTFTLTPVGKLYFLSNLSGKIDVVKTNLDGTDRQTVRAGTGNEDPDGTSLLASTDWKYLALLTSNVGSDKGRIDLIDTSTDTITNIDDGNASFSLVGWQGHHFIYTVQRNDVKDWQSNQSSIKSFDADTKHITVLANSKASGTDEDDAVYSTFSDESILGDNVVYINSWYSNYDGDTSDKSDTLQSINVDGSDPTTVASYNSDDYYLEDLSEYEPQSLVLTVYSNDSDKESYYKLGINGSYQKDTDADVAELYEETDYPTFLQSPSGTQAFWSEQRDGKNTLLVGDSSGQHSHQIAALSSYSPYGWYSDNYLLVSKGKSELYIMPVSGSKTPLKVTDYYKPPFDYQGYGGGYGGL